MEFFSRAVWGKDEQLLELFAVLGSQIGQFVSRKRRETDLRRSEEMFWRVAQNIGEVLWIADAGVETSRVHQPRLRGDLGAHWRRSFEAMHALFWIRFTPVIDIA